MSLDLRDARVLVAGGGSGIGLATAHAFARLGAHVVIAGRDGAQLAAAVVEVGHGAESRSFDLLDDATIEAFFMRPLRSTTWPSRRRRRKRAPFTRWLLRSVRVDEFEFFGAYRIARAAAIASGGSLTFVSGFLERRPGPESILQGAINAALKELARVLALELAPVRVNVVCPGVIDTSLYGAMDSGKRSAMFADVAAKLPVGFVGQAEDIAEAIVFVAQNRFATGSTILIDRGGTIA